MIESPIACVTLHPCYYCGFSSSFFLSLGIHFYSLAHAFSVCIFRVYAYSDRFLWNFFSRFPTYYTLHYSTMATFLWVTLVHNDLHSLSLYKKGIVIANCNFQFWKSSKTCRVTLKCSSCLTPVNLLTWVMAHCLALPNMMLIFVKTLQNKTKKRNQFGFACSSLSFESVNKIYVCETYSFIECVWKFFGN